MTDRAAPSELWDLAKTLINTLFSVFGEPQELAARGAVDRKAYLWLIAWLHACETLLRRLLLIEAKALNVPPASSRQRNTAGRMPAVHARQPFSLNPDDWRVSFRISDRRRLAGGDAQPPAGWTARRRRAGGAERRAPTADHSYKHHPALPLAHRAEALFRACKNPLPYARRLARFISRLPATIARILTPPRTRKRKSGDPPNVIDIIGHTTWADVRALLPNTS